MQHTYSVLCLEIQTFYLYILVLVFFYRTFLRTKTLKSKNSKCYMLSCTRYFWTFCSLEDAIFLKFAGDG